MILLIIKWWVIISLSALILLGLIILYDRIKYGPLKSYEDNGDY